MITIFLLREAPYNKKSISHKNMLLSSFKDIKKNNILLFIIIYSIIINGIINSFYKFHSLYFQEIGYSTVLIGLVYALMFFIAGLVGRITPYIENKIGLKSSLILIPLIVGFTYVVMGTISIYIIGFLIVLEAIGAGLYDITMIDLIQKNITSAKRATSLSVQSFSSNIMKVYVSLIIGVGSAIIGLPMIYVLFGLIILVAGCYFAKKIIKELSI